MDYQSTVSRDSYHHGNLALALVEAARKVLEAEGVHALSLRGVAREAGVSQAAPYHHFPNKEALLAAVAQVGFQELNTRLDGARASSDDIGAVLRAMGGAYVGFGLEHPQLYGLMFGSECPVERHPEMKAEGAAAFERLIAVVAEGQQAGRIRGEEPLGPSLGVWSTVHGLTSLTIHRLEAGKEFHGMQLDRQVLVDQVLAFVERALGVEP